MWPLPIAYILFVGGVCGAINGLIVIYGRLQPIDVVRVTSGAIPTDERVLADDGNAAQAIVDDAVELVGPHERQHRQAPVVGGHVDRRHVDRRTLEHPDVRVQVRCGALVPLGSERQRRALDPASEAAKSIYDQFHARAVWMTKVGFRLLANLPQ